MTFQFFDCFLSPRAFLFGVPPITCMKIPQIQKSHVNDGKKTKLVAKQVLITYALEENAVN